jgi:hypothetical protein
LLHRIASLQLVGGTALSDAIADHGITSNFDNQCSDA